MDSGATISALSEQAYASITRNLPEGQLLSVLPVTGITVTTAVKGRSRKITSQVLIPFSVFGFQSDCIFLVIPHLATPVILGDDWLTNNKVQLNYSERSIYLPLCDLSIPFTRLSNDDSKSLNSCFSVITSPHTYSRSESDHLISSVVTVSKHLNLDSSVAECISFLNKQVDTDCETFHAIDEHVKSIQSLSVEQIHEFSDLLYKYHDIFKTRPGLNRRYTCRFDVSEDIPFKIRPYPIPFARRPAVDKELQRMIDWGVIERCSSPYSSPILCVGKADGTVRLCLDARRINKIIVPMRDSSPPLDELLAQFGGKSLFSSLDFTAGYWQVPLHCDVRKFTAFVYNGRTYQFCVVPFGLNISNTAFQQALESVLAQNVGSCEDTGLDDLHIYVDDLLISTISFSDHINRLRLLFQKILKSGMTLKLHKCEFFKQRIKFLGHIVTPSGVSMDPSKLQAVHEFPVPRNKKDLQSFVGFCNFYRKFADHHGVLISPLIDLLKKDVPWRFESNEIRLFEAVKSAFNERFLAHPDFTKEFYLQTDASGFGLGAELFQGGSSERKTISFASRTLNAAERNYSVTELELLSIVFACDKFRVFLLGHIVNVITDHQALVFLFRCRLRNARLTRWTLILQEFDLRIKHIPGPSNIIDILSRNPVNRDEYKDHSKAPCIFLMTPKTLLTQYEARIQSFRHIVSEQRLDLSLLKIIDMLTGDVSVSTPVAQQYCLYHDTLFYRRCVTSDMWLVCIPTHQVNNLIQNFHIHFGHVGPKKCISAIRDVCFFRGLSTTVRNVVKRCDLCQRTKYSTVRTEGSMQHVVARSPLERVCVDLFGPLPPGWNHVCHIFVVLDCFSRFVCLYPIKRANARVVTNRMVHDYIEMYGCPKTVVSDHGVQFMSKVWQTQLINLGIPPTTTSVYHPQSNPAERVMRELGRLFRTYCYDQHMEWPRYIKYIEWVLNNTVHEATGFTPRELFLRQSRYSPIHEAIECPPSASIDVNMQLIMANEVQNTKAEWRKLRHDRRGKPIQFVVGELVLVRAHRQSSAVDKCIRKFFLLYEGPYSVAEVKNVNAYVLVNPDTKVTVGTYNVVFLRKYFSPTIPL